MNKLKILTRTFISICISCFIANKFLGIESANMESLYFMISGAILAIANTKINNN